MTIQKLPGSAITPGTITVTQLESSVATTVQTGGGPKLTNIQVTDNTYTVLDDTAVDITGGYIKITGTGFVTGCSVIVGQLAAASVTFISSTEVRAQLSAQSAGTYIVYLVNPDGGVGIRVNGVTHSASPAWQTASGLPDQYDGVAINLSLVATDATSYTITSGSLPPGLSLNSNTGVISGTVSGVANDTLYTFTVRATDAQLQDSPRTFTVTITVSDPYFKLTTLLLSGSALSANTVIRDSSTNNFNLIAYGDARASNFTPYGTGWSTYFSSTSGITVSGLTPIGSGDLTIETFIYMTTLSGEQHMVQQGTSTTNLLLSYDGTAQRLRFLVRNDAGSSNLDINSPNAPVINQWFHFAGTVQGTTGRMWIDGNVVTTGTVSGTRSGSQTFVYMGDNGSGGSRPLTGYLSNTRIVVGTAVYTANFSPTTTNLSSVSGTSLLTNQSNRFINLVGNVAATISQGSPRITSFNPFNITNTGVNGSMYFDGTGDYIQAANSTNLDVGTGDFSIEAWCYKTNTSTATDWRVMGGSVSSSGFFGDGGTTSSRGFGIGRSGVAWDVTSNVQAPIYEWFHICYTRKSGAVRIFLNGKLIAYATGNTNNYGLNAGTLQIVAEQGGNLLTGYLTDFRLFKTVPASYDTAITTINNQVFTPPTQPLTAVTNTQLLTLQYDQPQNNHTFLDSSSNQFLITRSGNASQGTFSPFSQAGWSTYLYDGLIQASMGTNGQFGTGDFTVDIWVYPLPGSQATGNLIWSFALYPNGIFLTYGNDGAISVFSYGATRISGSAGTLTLNAWSYIAVSRSSTALRLFVNGSQVGSTYTDSSNYTQGFYGIGRPDDVASYYYRGYLSNFRVVKGTALYTANFTPSTSSLTAVTNTQLLILQSNRYRDNSTNNYAITVSGTYSIQAFSPFAPTAVYNPATHGGSAYFDRTGDFLSLATNNSFDFGTGNFTVELFYYPLAYDDIQMFFSGTSNYQFGYSAFDSRNLYYYGSSGNVISGTPAASMLLNQWNHIVLVRSGTSLAIMSNGVRQGTATHSSSVNFSGSPIVGGYADSTASYAIRGYMAGFRAVKGVAIYDPTQITYTVPTAPVSATTNTSLLLNFTDSAILDSTGRNVLETVADAKSSSVITKFTGGSMYFDGTGDYLVVPSSVLHLFGTQAFTLEAWVYTTSTKQYQHIYGTHNADTNWLVRLLDNKIMMYTGSADITGVTVLATNTWYHVAAVREGIGTNQTKLYVNGTLDVTGTNATNYTTQSQAWIGAQINNPGLTYFQGYIADLRVTRGYARYTANFTAPTAPARLK